MGVMAERASVLVPICRAFDSASLLRALFVCKRKSERERGRERERLGESVRGDGDHSLMVEEGHEGGATLCGDNSCSVTDINSLIIMIQSVYSI